MLYVIAFSTNMLYVIVYSTYEYVTHVFAWDGSLVDLVVIRYFTNHIYVVSNRILPTSGDMSYYE